MCGEWHTDHRERWAARGLTARCTRPAHRTPRFVNRPSAHGGERGRWVANRTQRRIADMSTFTIQHEQEEDGRWIAEVPELPGVLAYGATADEAMAKAQALALRVLAERLEHKEAKPEAISIGIAAA